jgi:ribose/xylose/arabinose/galactoside ABC-type transport system permease subunit
VISPARALASLGRQFLFRRSLSLAVVIVILVAVLTIAYPGVFLSTVNLSSILLNMAMETIVVVGMAVLLIGGEVDLSVGWNLGLSGVIYALLMTRGGLSVEAAIPITLLIGAACGLVVGAIVAYLRVNSFITTLAAGLCYYGIMFNVAGGRSVSRLGPEVTNLGMNSLLGLQYPVWYAAVIVVVFLYLMGRTRLFRQYYYIGLSNEVALMSGIPVARMKLGAFVLSSLLASFAGIISAARYASAILLVGQGMELKVITAAMVGGISFTGGIGTMTGALLGESFIALINNGMIIAAIDAFWQPIMIGVILLLAVVLDVTFKRMSTSGRGAEASARRRDAAPVTAPPGGGQEGKGGVGI